MAVRVTRKPLKRNDHSARSTTEFECQSLGLGGETFPGEHSSASPDPATSNRGR